MFTSHCLKNRIGRALASVVALSLLLNCVPSLAHWSIRYAQAGPQTKTLRTIELARTASLSEPTQSKAQVVQAYGQLELSFEANHGQTDSRVDFITHAPGATVYITPTEAVMVLSAADGSDPTSEGKLAADETLDAPPFRKKLVLRMKIEGGSATPEVHGLDELRGKVNYFIGNDPAKWRTNIPTFARVEYKDVYPGVDLLYYGSQRQLEYDFRLAPGTDAGQVALKFEGADALEVDAGGDLLIRTKLGTVRQLKPVVYQEVGGERREVLSGYALRGGGRVGFNLGNYDASKPLIIDPVLAYSTFLGGSGIEQGNDIAVDSTGNAYVTGVTSSHNFPTVTGFDNSSNGFEDVFITKINAAGSALIYSTYLGGSQIEVGGAIALDSAGSAYLTGVTFSTNFPTVNSIDNALAGSNDAFVAKLDASGSAIIYSTYLGGSDLDFGDAIDVDSAGNACVTGTTFSTDFPTAIPTDPVLSGLTDAFVTKFNASGSTLVYSTYFGGTNNESGTDITVDSAGSAYLALETSSPNLPTLSGAFDSNLDGSQDAFVAKLNGLGALIYGTYLGGSHSEFDVAIAVDSAGNAYLSGTTGSTDFPTANPIDNALSGSTDAFVTKLNTTGSELVYSTYLGGSGSEASNSIAVDSFGNLYVTGSTTSGNSFPTANSIQSTYGGMSDAFVTKLNAGGASLVFSTYLGGNLQDFGLGVAVDSAGNVYLAGTTQSPDFPTTPNPFQEVIASHFLEAFVAKIGEFSIAGRAIDLNAQPLPGVLLTMSGASSGVTQTDANGYFAFLNTLLNGNYVVVPAKNGVTFSPSSHGFSLSANREIVFVGSSTAPTPTPMANFAISGQVLNANGIGIDAVTVALGGSQARITTTDAAGAFSFTGLPGGVNYTVTPARAGYTFNQPSFTINQLSGNQSLTFIGTQEAPANAFVQFSQADYTVAENFNAANGINSILITVTRSGDSSLPAIVNYSSSDTAGLNSCNPAQSSVSGVASARCDYGTAVGTLRFASGETTKTFPLIVVDDVYVEGPESLTLRLLNNPSGVNLGAQSTATVTITDNDTTAGAPNPIYSTPFFIRQHYIDFLNREPDSLGYAAWQNVLNNCPPANSTCDQVEVSSAFFRSPEFRARGSFVYHLYAASLGRIPLYAEFIPDLAKVTGFQSPAELDVNKSALAQEFIARPEFDNRYSGTTNQEYVDLLLTTAGVISTQRDGWIASLDANTKTRASVLRELAESSDVSNKFFVQSFVVMQYFGYLRRDPDPLYTSWIAVMNSDPNNYRQMVNGFVNSLEYRLRFGP